MLSIPEIVIISIIILIIWSMIRKKPKENNNTCNIVSKYPFEINTEFREIVFVEAKKTTVRSSNKASIIPFMFLLSLSSFAASNGANKIFDHNDEFEEKIYNLLVSDNIFMIIAPVFFAYIDFFSMQIRDKYSYNDNLLYESARIFNKLYNVFFELYTKNKNAIYLNDSKYDLSYQSGFDSFKISFDIQKMRYLHNEKYIISTPELNIIITDEIIKNYLKLDSSNELTVKIRPKILALVSVWMQSSLNYSHELVKIIYNK